jgi:hypothetical protein
MALEQGPELRITFYVILYRCQCLLQQLLMVETLMIEVEAEVKLRPTVSRPVRPGVRHPSGTRDQLFFLLEIFFRQLRVRYFVASSLARGPVWNLLLLLVLVSAVLQDLRPYFIAPILETPLTWWARSPCLYPSGKEWPSYTPVALGALAVASYDSQGYGGGILSRLHTGGIN